MKKTRYLLALGAMLSAAAISALTTPAEARTRCVYMGHNPSTGHMIADGWAKAAKKSWACNRARRRCNRELERKRRKRQVPRGVVCRRIHNL